MVQGAWGIIPAHISELSPDAVRGFLPGFSYQCGNLIAASVGYLQSTLAEDYKYPYPLVMLTTVSTTFAFAIVITLIGKERHGQVFGEI
jgi:SHS family lactate transporter-like MFS transporter